MTDSYDRLPIRTVWRTLEPVNVKQKQHSCCSNIKRVTHQPKQDASCFYQPSLTWSWIKGTVIYSLGLTCNLKLLIWEIKLLNKLFSTHSLSPCTVKHPMDVSSQACVCLFTGLLYPQLCEHIHFKLWIRIMHISLTEHNGLNWTNGRKWYAKSMLWLLKSVNACLWCFVWEEISHSHLIQLEVVYFDIK